MERLVHDKVENFWRVIQADPTRRGKVRHQWFTPKFRSIACSSHSLDHCYLLWETTKKIVVPALPCRRRCPLGAMVRSNFSYQAWASQLPDSRIINVEFRQHKAERGTFSLPSFITRIIYTCTSDRLAFNANLTNTLSKSIQVILVHTSSERGRAAVPPITQSSGISPFPFKIAAHVGGMEIGNIWPPMAFISTNVVFRIQWFRVVTMTKMTTNLLLKQGPQVGDITICPFLFESFFFSFLFSLDPVCLQKNLECASMSVMGELSRPSDDPSGDILSNSAHCRR